MSMLDTYFKYLHDELRNNAQWYMRQDMVRDFSDRGGCCSHRQLFKAIRDDGHCTRYGVLVLYMIQVRV